MSGVSYALADFVTGGPIVDLPVMEGADWGTQLNRPDTVSCKLDLRDKDVRDLDIRSASAPGKTVLLARTEDDVVLAWGLINDDREWNEDEQTLSLSAKGIWGSWLTRTIIAPTTARTAALIVNDADGFPVVNPALSVAYTGFSLGTIGKKLVAQRLAWPGAPTVFDLPADELGTHDRTDYLFANMKTIASALTDLTNVDNGPDFAFDAQRASDGLTLRYIMRHGSEARPRIGTDVGVWSLGPGSPITGLTFKDSPERLGSAVWMSAGRTGGKVLISRALNDQLIAAGYPPMDLVDTSHGDVTTQALLDSYAAELFNTSSQLTRDVSFSVRGDASPRLGQYRPGDTVSLDVPSSHPFLSDMPIRITSMSGDETGKSIKIGCVVLDA